jgi:hypothetical protein
MPEELVRSFSKRTDQIDAELDRLTADGRERTPWLVSNSAWLRRPPAGRRSWRPRRPMGRWGRPWPRTRLPGHAVAGDRAQVDAWVAGGWDADELVEADAVGSGKGSKNSRVGRRLQIPTGQVLHRDAGRCRQGSQGGLSLAAQRPEPWWSAVRLPG